MTENVDKSKKLNHEDHCQTIHRLADTAEISYGNLPGDLNRKFELAPSL
jgi:hypothetical protein